MTADLRVDVAILGAGGAGMTLLHQLARRGPAGLRIAVIDPVDRLRERPADRTWCFWDGGSSDVDAAVHRSWPVVSVVRAGGSRRRLDLRPLRYVMVRSQDLYAVVAEQAQHLELVSVTEPAVEVVDTAEGATVVTETTSVRAAHVFDSRPAAPMRPARTTLLQHFRGIGVRTATDVFDPQLPTLMDFRTAQPAGGLSFGYVLPSSARTALVEYTEFSPEVLSDDGYERALTAYLPMVIGAASYERTHVEHGVIPMTDAVFARRAGRHVYRLGTAGGATRASTGYTFSAMLRQGAAVADALVRGREPLPPPPFPARHRWLDALYLRALADGSLDGPRFFADLFERNAPSQVLTFLDGTAGIAADASVVRSAPWRPMLMAGAGDLAARLGRRRAEVARAAARRRGRRTGQAG